MKITDLKIFIADKLGRMNTKFSNFNLHLFIKKLCTQCPEHKQWNSIFVEQFEEETVMKMNNSEFFRALTQGKRTGLCNQSGWKQTSISNNKLLS